MTQLHLIIISNAFERHELEHDCSLFNGVVRDEADSRVVLTLCSNSLMWHGIIYLNHETHILEPIQGTDHHVIYNEQDDTALTCKWPSFFVIFLTTGLGNTRSALTGCNYEIVTTDPCLTIMDL